MVDSHQVRPPPYQPLAGATRAGAGESGRGGWEEGERRGLARPSHTHVLPWLAAQGFGILTRNIRTTSTTQLLWLVGVSAFVLSSVS